MENNSQEVILDLIKELATCSRWISESLQTRNVVTDVCIQFFSLLMSVYNHLCMFSYCDLSMFL